MIKHGEPNPLNVFGLRQLDHNPPHFTNVPFELKASNKQITDWIWENLEGRFWFGDHYQTDTDGSIQIGGFRKVPIGISIHIQVQDWD